MYKSNVIEEATMPEKKKKPTRKKILKMVDEGKLSEKEAAKKYGF